MNLIIASNNENKIREIKQILAGKFDTILSLKEAGVDHETVEDGTTFLENARKKAVEIAMLTGQCALADDSGICVPALNGAPGIYSARFCGRHGDDEANNRLLLEKMKETDDHRAYYECAMVLANPNGNEITAEGQWEGIIVPVPAGTNGFGYDPIFYLPEYGKTAAQISPEEKNKISHRAKALQRLVQQL